MRLNQQAAIRTKAKTLEWQLPMALITLKLFTYWALVMSDWILKFR